MKMMIKVMMIYDDYDDEDDDIYNTDSDKANDDSNEIDPDDGVGSGNNDGDMQFMTLMIVMMPLLTTL